jgi:hypothetical protein
MKASVSFLLLPLALLSACIMETPMPPNEMGDHFIREWFDFVSSDFNRATFDTQRALWQERHYTDYEGELSLSTSYNSNSEAPSYYLCRFIVKAGKDPEAVWFEGENQSPFEGALPEDFPSVYTIDGIYDYILAVIENLALRAKEGNEEFSVFIRYDSLFNIPNCVQITRLENGIYQAIRTIGIGVRHHPAVKRPELSAFDRETFEQEYHAWKELGIKNYRYSLHIENFLDRPEGVPARMEITVLDGKEPEVSGDASPLEDCTIDGVFDFIASMLEDPSFSGCNFFVAYRPECHIPAELIAAFIIMQREEAASSIETWISFKLSMTLDSFEILTR